MSSMNEKMLEAFELEAVTAGSETGKTGWDFADGYWYYYNASGKMITGWLLDGGHWYYFNERGEMQTGWIEENGIWYYFQPNGELEGERHR